MKVKMSDYLENQKNNLISLVEKLSKNFDYVSVLGVDTKGKSYSVKRSGTSISDSIFCERGFVVRIHNGTNYSEFSFNQISDDNLEYIVKEIKETLMYDFKKMKDSLFKTTSYPVIEEDKLVKNYYGEVKILPENINAKDKINRLTTIMNSAIKCSKYLLDFRVIMDEVHVSKIFVSSKKLLEQSYIHSKGTLAAIVRKENNTKFNYKGFSGLKGVEILDEMENEYEKVVSDTINLLDAQRVEPGVYDIICSPGVAGLIAHEAFGHGVEMDMFVKNRAKAVEYLDKQVASNLVTMHDGAASAKHVASYLFDDEGILGTDTKIINNGILKTGISDLLSALKLGNPPTGNGRRQSFERKAYTRMTNTFFAKGNDKLESMISSINKGYLLDGVMSGMEDPKNWGIQCMILKGKEIINGELTGKLVSPVIMTGYVPDLLNSISMVSNELELYGSGICGKGHKEFVNVSDGGPYIKARGRLG